MASHYQPCLFSSNLTQHRGLDPYSDMVGRCKLRGMLIISNQLTSKPINQLNTNYQQPREHPEAEGEDKPDINLTYIINNILQTINTISSIHSTILPTTSLTDTRILDPYLFKKDNTITNQITHIKLFHKPSSTIDKFNEVFPLPTNFYKRNKDGNRIWTKTGFIRFKPKKSVQPERDKQITDHLTEMHIIEEIPKPKRFYGQMFVIQKGADSWRPIFNYATLTPFIYSPTFILPNVFQVAKRLKWTQNLWYTKIDIAQAFFNLNIHQDSKFVTAFESNNKFYQFNCLPFGISNAPYNCQLMINQVTKHIKKSCPLVWAHLD